MTISVSNRAEAVRKYFTKTPAKPDDPDYSRHQIKMSIGGGLFLLALILFSTGKGLPILLSIVSIYFGFKLLTNGFSAYSKQKKEYKETYKKYEKDHALATPKPSDQQMDEWLWGDRDKIIQEALRRLEMDHEDYKTEPFIIGGPAPLEETRYARGRDGKTRYSHFNILVVFLTDYHIAAYFSVNSMEYGQIISDNTNEFPYQEITNLGTETVKEKITFCDDSIVSESGLQAFTLSTRGANIIRVPYSFTRNTDELGELLKIGEEKTISVIRKKLQDYKKKYER